jgi:monoamine oxidase
MASVVLVAAAHLRTGFRAAPEASADERDLLGGPIDLDCSPHTPDCFVFRASDRKVAAKDRGETQMQTDVLVIGAGLAGLGLARILEERGDEILIVEARDRIGGRILSQTGARPVGLDTSYDLSPAWFWTGQPQLARLASEFGLNVFEQYAAGRLIFQDTAGSIRRDLEIAPMAGSLRIAGGMAGLAVGLLQRLPKNRLLIGHYLTKLSQRAKHIQATLHRRAEEVEVTAQKVVLAVPPRVAENGTKPLPADAGRFPI